MFARHDLAWLSAEGWRQAAASAPAAAAPALAAWRQAGWPAVVRRADAGLAPGELALGVALPPCPQDGRKVRVACRVAAATVLLRRPPLALAQVAAALPCWRSGLSRLAREAAAAGLEIRVYGSAALQVLTGQAYLRAGSDIDLLLQPRDPAALEAGLALLRAHAAHLPLDGEIVFPGGRAVAWKEWAAAFDGAAGTRVLVKDAARVSLALPEALRAALEGAPCPT